MLSRVKISYKDLRLAILAVNESVISEQLLNQLRSYIPTSEEQALLAECEGDADILGNSEQFYLEIMKIPRYEQRLAGMQFKRKFIERASEIRPVFETLLAAIQQIRSCPKISRILAVRCE